MIEFIVPAYNRPDALMCLLASLKAQTSPDWKCHVIIDGANPYDFRFVVAYVRDDKRICFTWLDRRHNDWGHTPRNIGLENAKESWICMTGDDNYYAPTFVSEILNAANPDVKFIYTNMVHNFTNSHDPLAQAYVGIDCAPRWGKIDIGNSVYRTEYAKQMRLDPKQETADGYFCEEYIKRFPGMIVKIPKLLYVHN